MESESGEEGSMQELEQQPDTAGSPMQQSPDQSNYMEEYRSPEATGADQQDLEEHSSGMEIDNDSQPENGGDLENEDESETADDLEMTGEHEKADDLEVTGEREKADDLENESELETADDLEVTSEHEKADDLEVKGECEKADDLEVTGEHEKADNLRKGGESENENDFEQDSDTGKEQAFEGQPDILDKEGPSDKEGEPEQEGECDMDGEPEEESHSDMEGEPEKECEPELQCELEKEGEDTNESNNETENIDELMVQMSDHGHSYELSEETREGNVDEGQDSDKSDIEKEDISENNEHIDDLVSGGQNSNPEPVLSSSDNEDAICESEKLPEESEITSAVADESENCDLKDNDAEEVDIADSMPDSPQIDDIHSGTDNVVSGINEFSKEESEDNSNLNSDIQDIGNSDIEDMVESINVVQDKTEVESEVGDIYEQSDIVESQPEESIDNGAKLSAIDDVLTNVDDNSQAESNDLDSDIYDIGPSETDTTANVGEEVLKPEEVVPTSVAVPNGEEKDEGEISEASLEEVSEEEEDMKDDRAAESGIEEVSDEEEDEGAQGNVSGVEEVSDEEEEDDDDDAAIGGIVEVDLTHKKHGSDAEDRHKRTDKPTGRANKVAVIKKKAKRELEEGEEDDESGMEEVSEEEEEERSESEEEEDEDRQKEEGSEGMEDVSSEEEDDHDPKDIKVTAVADERTVEIKQNGGIVKIDDTGKEDSVIVQEILENMTIKIDNVGKPEKKRSGSDRRDRDRHERDKSRKKKERRESVRSRTGSSAMKSEKKDTRDINERLKAQASYGEDIELDYDDVHDEMKDKAGSESGGLSTSESDEGELIDEEDCEEGEIREPGQKPFIKPTCRFFMRGHCTWGVNCRFLHPGVNDKGYYQLIERPGFNNKPPTSFEDQWEEQERSPSPEPPPPAKEPKEETAWERGLRQAKELRKKALERRELDTNFEHKKMNLSIEENPEFNKENAVEEERKPKKKPYYYEKEVFSDDEYYDQTPVRLQQKQQQEQSWMPGQYENFEVRWSRESYYPPPQANYSGPHPPPAPHQHARYPQYEQSFRGRDRGYPQHRTSPRQFSPSPPPHYQGNQRYPRMQRDPRIDIPRREKARERLESPPTQKPLGHNPVKARADEWHDPWRRSNANKPKSPGRKRSRSRGRRRSRRSHSYSSSYSSSSYSDSSRSRSRSSSYSSVSSRSRSRSRSSSASSRRSSPRRNVPADNRRRFPPGNFPGNRRFPQQEHPRNTVGFRGQGRGRSPDKRPGMNRGSPMKGMNKGPMPMQSRGPMSQGRAPGHDPRAPMPQGRAPMGKIADVGRRPDRGAQQQRKFQMEVKQRDRPLPPSGLKEKRMSGRRRSASSSRSRSRSSSGSSSRSSSYSSRSSGSRSSSSSSSGSADSDHLYRNIGGKDNQKPPAQRGRPADRGRYRHHPDSRQKMPPKPDSKGMVIREGEFGKPLTALPQKPKDPLKMTGQKSNIKLTLIKPSEKAAGGPDQMGKKRPADQASAGPPPKRQAIPSQPKPAPEKIPKKPEKAGPVSPTKPVQSPIKAVAPAGQAPAVRKKSTVNRREELLKQLKAVEDAIAKKKKKMT